MLGWSRPVRRSISVQTLASFPFTFFFLMSLNMTGWIDEPDGVLVESERD